MSKKLYKVKLCDQEKIAHSTLDKMRKNGYDFSEWTFEKLMFDMEKEVKQTGIIDDTNLSTHIRHWFADQLQNIQE